ncbi:hypothetical protein ACFSSA_00825 [Luteolibacter algae]|uniref:Uncharacterized protein n=2 Tax=Luteolibacter algae TaxID=454151 RepID=A0ABW5D6F1_9BACT
MVPALFLALSLGVVLGMKAFLQREPDTSTRHSNQPSETATPPKDEGDTFESLTGDPENTALPTEAPVMPAIAEPNSETPPEQEAKAVDGGIAANALLEKFLSMDSLEERMPHLETRRDESELIDSPLNSSLPEIEKITVDVRETNSIEQVIDYYYLVDFATESGTPNLQTMLVRTRGTGPPKVVVDPFLDLYGGRFANFAASPGKDAGTFQVIISAGAFCYDDVPNPEKKFTLKILAREDAKEIAKAYFGKKSKIGYMLEDETSGLAYGQPKPCTVFMRWNTEEDPEKPFLEALDIKALNWNP